MKRKLVQQGASTLMISLPSKWIKERQLEKGSEVSIEPSESNLVISATEGKTAKKQVSIELPKLIESSIRTLITNTYRKGYDIINVAFSSEQQFRILQDTIKTRLIGFEITKKERNNCIVENVTEPSLDQFDAMLSKVFLSVESLFDVTKKRLENDDDGLEDFEEIEERIQKYDNFCRRVISKRSDGNSNLLWTFLTLVLHGQRELYHLNGLIKKKKVSNKVIEYLDDVKSLFILLKRAFLEKDVRLLAEMHELEKKLIYQRGYHLLEESARQESVIVYHMMSSARKFYQANSPLQGLLL